MPIPSRSWDVREEDAMRTSREMIEDGHITKKMKIQSLFPILTIVKIFKETYTRDDMHKYIF